MRKRFSKTFDAVLKFLSAIKAELAQRQPGGHAGTVGFGGDLQIKVFRKADKEKPL